MNASQKINFITRTRNETVNLLTAIDNLKELKSQWDALDLGNVLADGDFLGDNEGLTKAELAAVIGTTLPAIETLLAAGHATNLYKLVK